MQFNFANTLLNSGKYTEAIEAYRKTSELKPNFYRAKINLGTTLLSMANFADGFKEYSYRIYEDKNFQSVLDKKNSIWNGQNIENKKILVIADDGFGNTLPVKTYFNFIIQCN